MLKQGKFSRISLEKNGFDRRLMVLLEGETVTCCTTRSQIEAAAWMVIEHYKQAELRRSMAEMQSDGNVDLQKLQSRIAELNLLNPEKAETENPVEDVFVYIAGKRIRVICRPGLRLSTAGLKVCKTPSW